MRTITHIIIHCSGTYPERDITVKTIDHWHRRQGYKSIGYHYVILPDGSIEKGRGESITGAHCEGYNKASIGICYIGGHRDYSPDRNRNGTIEPHG